MAFRKGCFFLLLMALFAWTTLPVQAGNRMNGWFVIGANLAWFDHDYGHDLGPSHPEKWSPAFKPETCRRYFADLAAMGCKVVRVWVFERQQGMLFDSQDKLVVGLDEKLLQNCDTLMKIAAENRLYIYWTLLNHLIVEDEEGKHMNIISDPQVRESFINNAVIPFLKRYGKSSHFFAVDIINEAEGAIGGIDALSGAHNPLRGVTWRTMLPFIKTVAAAIHRDIPGVKVTSTSGWHEHNNLGRYKDLGLDFLDFHSYHDSGKLPYVKDLDVGNLPVIVGECGPEKKSRDDALTAKNWKAYIQEAYQKGYAGVLPWSYGAPGEDTNFTAVNADRTWRPAASVIQTFTRTTGDAGPTFWDPYNKSIMASVNAAIKPILAVGPSSIPNSSWNRLMASLQKTYPYRNPDFALRKLDEMSLALYDSCKALLKKEAEGKGSPQISNAVANLKVLAFRAIAAIKKTEDPGRKTLLGSQAVRGYLNGVLSMTAAGSGTNAPVNLTKPSLADDPVPGISPIQKRFGKSGASPFDDK